MFDIRAFSMFLIQQVANASLLLINCYVGPTLPALGLHEFSISHHESKTVTLETRKPCYLGIKIYLTSPICFY